MNNGTYTEARPGTTLTLEKLQEAMNFINTTKRTVISFSHHLSESMMLEGLLVDKLLNCNKYEKGLLIPAGYKDEIVERFKGAFEIR